jgi:DUF4097 and DUF4098 domain-containing protein YvlB
VTSYEFAVTDPELDIDVKAASVVLDRGPVGTVSVQIDTKNPEDWIVSQHGSTITVRDEQSGRRLRKGSSRVRITTPDGTAAAISTASGDITVVVATGRTVVTTASGDVRVGVASALTVKSASGDVRVDRVAGDVNLRTASGDLVAAAVGGRFESSTASGDVRVEQVLGNARISTASGDIRIARFEGAEFAANTVSGDVSLGIPSGRAVDLDVKTLSGDVSLPERRTAPATPPVGRVTIRVKSVSGDFRLSRA